jgi:pimeloyl-ACP methyl ester carboxylesterase
VSRVDLPLSKYNGGPRRSFKLSVHEDGDRCAPPVVLLHGLAASMRWWDTVVTQLKCERHIVRVDLLGHGASPLPRGEDGVESQAELVAGALLERGVRPATVVGHSLGGLVAAALSERFPETVAGLVFISTIPSLSVARLDWRGRLVARPMLGAAVWRIVGDRRRVAHARVLFAPGFAPLRELVADLNRIRHLSVARSSRMALQYWRERPINERLRSEMPVTVVFGGKDQTIDVSAAVAMWQYRGRRVVLLGAAGHSPHVELPEEIARVILTVENAPAAGVEANGP